VTVKVTFHKCKREMLVSIPPSECNICSEPSLLSWHPLVLAETSDFTVSTYILGMVWLTARELDERWIDLNDCILALMSSAVRISGGNKDG
jgi:hypothetical protein